MWVLKFFSTCLLLFPVMGHWWLSSQVFSADSTAGCNNMAGLAKEQIELCRKYPFLMEIVGKGARKALIECQQQFAFFKWNCSHVDQKQRVVLGKLTNRGNRETAFFRAITSAGVTDEITRACNMDKYSDACRCEKVHSLSNNRKLKWNGCSDNIRFGMMFAQLFLDAKEKGTDARVLMNKQNNLAGRMAVKENMFMDCICHGVSGTCNMKTCRNSLPPFYHVGNFLQQRYHSAIYASFDQTRNELVPLNHGVLEYTKLDLVYLEASPDYCIKDDVEGTLGVAGRQCNKTSPGPDGCDVMCCGMGFHTKKVIVESNCNCKFHWCCNVKCERCTSVVKQYFCRGQTQKRRIKKIGEKEK